MGEGGATLVARERKREREWGGREQGGREEGRGTAVSVAPESDSPVSSPDSGAHLPEPAR